MCYAPSVMLRGRGSCTISDRLTTSPFVSPSLFHPLTPLLPLDTSHSPVTPLFPLHTQKQGGRACLLHVQLLALNCFSPLTLIIPALTDGPPVSPIIPAHAQNRGWGASHPMRPQPANLYVLPFFYLQLRYKCRRADIFISQPQRSGIWKLVLK